jgi:multisubunit Na+/H+ antiporter MnhG subunit
MSVAVWFLVWLAVALELAACLGLLLARSVFDRLHFVSAAATVGPFAAATAILLEEGWTTAGIDALVAAVLLLMLGATATHATARAAHLRLHGSRGEPRPARGER